MEWVMQRAGNVNAFFCIIFGSVFVKQSPNISADPLTFFLTCTQIFNVQVCAHSSQTLAVVNTSCL